MTTQFVVGATSDTDRATLGRAMALYRDGGVHHAHYSAFRPIRDTPLESRRAAPAVREHRLYQADHLVRRYRFGPDEIVFDAAGNLPLATDPKAAWALAHPERFPVDVMRAAYSELVRVPGIGPVVARRLVDQRRCVVIRGVHDLHALGVIVSRAAGFLELGGRRLAAERWREQLAFWSPGDDVGSYGGAYEFSPGTFR